MVNLDGHIRDHDLLLGAEGELSKRRISEIRTHLASCQTCRTRMKQIEDTIRDFALAYRDTAGPQFQSQSVSRGRFKARLSRLAAEPSPTAWRRAIQPLFVSRRWAYLSCTVTLVLGLLVFFQSSEPSLALSPNPTLTPGATLPVTQTDICSPQQATRSRLVLASTGKKVFEEYGIRNPKPHRYELDYLIDPDLGGSDDSRNLWPQPYSAVWNAHVKDALEMHLRGLVCSGEITLAQAQQDISTDWISAYKKYFQTDSPLSEHIAFTKDQPWE